MAYLWVPSSVGLLAPANAKPDEETEPHRYGGDRDPKTEAQETPHTVTTRPAVGEVEHIVFLPLTGGRRHLVRDGCVVHGGLGRLKGGNKSQKSGGGCLEGGDQSLKSGGGGGGGVGEHGSGVCVGAKMVCVWEDGENEKQKRRVKASRRGTIL